MKIKTFIILIVVLSIISVIAMPVIAMCFYTTEASIIPEKMSFEPLIATPSPEPVEKLTFEEINDTVKQNIFISVYDEDDSLESVRYDSTPANVTEISDVSPTIINSTSEINKYILDLCTQYFTPQFNGVSLSPYLVMAIANTETGGRCDLNKTYTSLFPSAVVPLNNTSDIDNMNSATLLLDKDYFKSLATDWQSRDRGPLQIQAGFGTNDATLNSLMGKSEVDNYASVSMPENEPEFSANETKASGRTLSLNTWISEASKYPGDRFNPKDICLRATNAYNLAINDITKQYDVTNEKQLYAMLAVFHQASSVWNSNYRYSNIGNWISGQQAYEYCKKITSDEFLNIIREHLKENIENAKAEGKNPRLTITDAIAKEYYEEAIDKGIVDTPFNYVRDRRYYWITYCYPIRLLYNFEMVKYLYEGTY